MISEKAGSKTDVKHYIKLQYGFFLYSHKQRCLGNIGNVDYCYDKQHPDEEEEKKHTTDRYPIVDMKKRI